MSQLSNRWTRRDGVPCALAVMLGVQLVGPAGAKDPEGWPVAVSPAPPGARVHVPQGMFSHSLHAPNPGCAAAKLDVWFNHGRYMVSVLVAGEQGSNATGDQDGTVLIIGGEGCRYRVRIERAD